MNLQIKTSVNLNCIEEANSDELLRLILGDRTYEKNKLTASDLQTFRESEAKYYTEKELLKLLSLKELIGRGYPVKNMLKISTPEDVAKAFDYMKYYEQEHLVLICLTTKNEIISTDTLFKGTIDTSVYHPREIFKRAINKNAKSIILLHNHPSGNPEVSQEDINMSLRVRDAGNLMGIPLIDSIVIATNGFVSMKTKDII